MPAKLTKAELTLTVTFSAPELAQLEAAAALHGEAVTAFVQRVALEAAGAAPPKTNAKSRESDTSALWLTDGFSDASEAKEETYRPLPLR